MHERVHLPLNQQLLANINVKRAHQPVDVPLGVHPHVRYEHRDEDVLVASQLAHGDGLALQISSRADTGASEQLDASDVAPAQDDERCARVDFNQRGRAKQHADVDGARWDCVIPAGRMRNVLHVGESFALEQLERHELGYPADDRDLEQSEPRDFWRRLRECSFRAESHEAGGSCEDRATEQHTAVPLSGQIFHGKPPARGSSVTQGEGERLLFLG